MSYNLLLRRSTGLMYVDRHTAYDVKASTLTLVRTERSIEKAVAALVMKGL